MYVCIYVGTAIWYNVSSPPVRARARDIITLPLENPKSQHKAPRTSRTHSTSRCAWAGGVWMVG